MSRFVAHVNLLRKPRNGAFKSVKPVVHLLGSFRALRLIGELLADARGIPALAAVTNRARRSSESATDLSPPALPTALGALADFPPLRLGLVVVRRTKLAVPGERIHR